MASASFEGLLCVMQLCDLYNDDSIFDKFECCVSSNGGQFATGSYRFALFDL